MSERAASTPVWHTLTREAAAQQMGVDPARGLSGTDVAQRLQRHGPNVLSEAEKEPLWLAFLKQYKDYMRIVLTIAAVASLLIGEYSTAILLVLITAGSAWMAASPDLDHLSRRDLHQSTTVAGLRLDHANPGSGHRTSAVAADL